MKKPTWLSNVLDFSWCRRSDRVILWATVGLIIFGILMLSSATGVMSYHTFGNSYHYIVRQLLFLVIGLVVGIFLARTNYQRWSQWAAPILIGSIVLLLLLFVPGFGKVINGSRSWLRVWGDLSIQPSEFVKLALLIYLSAWLSGWRVKRGGEHKIEALWPLMLVFGTIVVLMLVQHDVGTLAIMVASAVAVFWIATGNWRAILVMALVGVVGLAGLISVTPYQRQRFACVADPSVSVQGYCYQVNQSMIAVGSGGLFGRGFGESREKYLYLPEVNNDFIFAVVGEELGFLLSALFIGVWLLIFYRGLAIAHHAPDDFSRNLAAGIIAWLAIQSIINIGGVINLLPMTGVPLPLISYGGSSIIATLAALGILLNISQYSSYARKKR